MQLGKLILTGLLGAGAAQAMPMFSILADHETIDPNILTQVSYQDYAYEYVNYEQAATSLSGSVSCLTEDKAKALGETAKKEIEKIFAEVGPSGDLAKLDVVIGGVYFEDPIVDSHRIEKNDKVELVFWNRCENKEVPFHENLPQVASTSVNVSITSDLTAEEIAKLDKAVDAIEAYANKTENLEIKCDINTTPAYRPQLSDAKRKEIESSLRERAIELAQEQADSDEINYESVFTLPLKSQADDVLKNANPTEFKKLENGEYEVTRTKRVDYNVRYYVGDDKSATEKLYSGLLNFPVQVQTSGKEGIFGVLNVSMRQDCFKSKEEAYKAFETYLDPSDLRELKGEASDVESDNLRRGKLDVSVNNQQRSFTRYSQDGESKVTQYYSKCNPEKILNGPLAESTEYFTASINHTLKLSDLPKLEAHIENIPSSESSAFGALKSSFNVKPMLRLDAQRILDLKNTKSANLEADKRAKAFKAEKKLDAAYLIQGFPRREFAGGFEAGVAQNKAVYLDQPINDAPSFPEEEGKELIQISHTILKQAVWSLGL